jgi:hypothetical protein
MFIGSATILVAESKKTHSFQKKSKTGGETIQDQYNRCFDFIPEKSSIGFGLSTSYVDDKNQPLYSVCKQSSWIDSFWHESFFVLGLHSEISTYTTHFKDGPIKRVQAYIEGANAISSKHCGHGGVNVYNYIGLSALNKARTTGILVARRWISTDEYET